MKYNNILFIHCPKNGGTYIQEEILRKDTSMNMYYRIEAYFGRVHKYKTNKSQINYFTKVVLFIILIFIYHEHFTLQQYSRKYNLGELEILFVCRNPYQKLLSSYNYLNYQGSLDSYLDQIESCRKAKSSLKFIHIDPLFYAHARNQTDYIKLNKSIYPRVHIVPLEDKHKLKQFCYENNLPYRDTQINISKKKSTLTLQQKERIYRIFKEDFDYFGYTK